MKHMFTDALSVYQQSCFTIQIFAIVPRQLQLSCSRLRKMKGEVALDESRGRGIGSKRGTQRELPNVKLIQVHRCHETSIKIKAKNK